MQLTVELKKALCQIDQNDYSMIFMFLLGYILFSLYNKSKNQISDEDKARRSRKSIKFFNRHQKENEEFFLGAPENETALNQ